MPSKIKIAVVNFATIWGNKSENLKKICEFCEKAHLQNVDLIVFPETALSGYDNDKENLNSDKMHIKLAETIPGKSTEIVANIAKKYGMYVVFGMPEKADNNIYNSAAIIHPDGKCESYRKIHLPFDEKEWAKKGTEPKIIETKWGKIGITICYDTYCFPELIRYYRAQGARLILNVTACPNIPCTLGSAKLALPAYAFTNYVFIASSNLCCREIRSTFDGGSCIIGPDSSKGGYKVYSGKMFGDKDSNKYELIVSEIDLSLADKYTDIPIFNGDWNPDIYIDLYSKCKK